MHKLLGANAPEHRNSVRNAIECANEEIECNIVYEIEKKKKRERVSDFPDYETMSWITTEHEQNRRVVYSYYDNRAESTSRRAFPTFHRTRYSLVLREEQFIKYRCTKKKKKRI